MVGMDIGTTQSKVAYVNLSGKPTIVLNDRGFPHTPSVVHVSEDGKTLVGADALEQGYVEPTRCARNFKLKLGTQESVLGNGVKFDPTDATAALIGYLKKHVEQAVGMEVTECVATCPANFRDDQKQALLEAFARNGIKVLLLLPEPTAAGYAYALNALRSKTSFADYDFGGGTFDSSVLEVDGSQITVLATEGVPKCGGNDLNQPIFERFLAEIRKQTGEEPTRSENPMLFSELDAKAESTKISLGNREKVPCVIGYKGNQIIVELTQEEFHRSIEPLVWQSLNALDQAIRGAGLTYTQIEQILLVGGSSRLPFIRESVAQHTGLQPKMDIDPDKAIAYGAALASVAEMAKDGRTATIRGQVIPDPAMFVRDVTAHGVGCCVTENSEGPKRLVNAILIPKNTQIPQKKTQHYYLEHGDQEEARIEILQGEADADRDKCLIIGELTLSDLPRESTRTERIRVECFIDTNGMVTATATDKVSGKQATVSVDYKKGIKPKDKPAAV